MPLVIVLVLPVVVAIALLVGSLSALTGGCANDIVQRVDSPGGEHSAVLFRRECGRGTGFSTQVSVLDRGEKPSDGGNTFVTDDDHGAATLASWGAPWAEVSWLSPSRLLIRYDEKARVFAAEASVAGVAMAYQAIGR